MPYTTQTYVAKLVITLPIVKSLHPKRPGLGPALIRRNYFEVHYVLYIISSNVFTFKIPKIKIVV
jgi:hypothetical protein